MCNFGGIASVLVRRAGDQTPYSVAEVGNWGARADREAILTQYGGDLPAGCVPCVVPGAPSAWITALEQFGTWSFADVSAPAAELATEGFPLDVRAAQELEVTGQDFQQWESSRQVDWPAGRPPRAGERLVQPALGRLLRNLAAAEHGASRRERLAAVHDAFYRGWVAQTLVDFVGDTAARSTSTTWRRSGPRWLPPRRWRTAAGRSTSRRPGTGRPDRRPGPRHPSTPS